MTSVKASVPRYRLRLCLEPMKTNPAENKGYNELSPFDRGSGCVELGCGNLIGAAWRPSGFPGSGKVLVTDTQTGHELDEVLSRAQTRVWLQKDRLWCSTSFVLVYAYLSQQLK